MLSTNLPSCPPPHPLTPIALQTPYTCAGQWSRSVWHAQRVLGSLYERIYDNLRARGVPPDDETVLWACLARLKDPKTGARALMAATCPGKGMGGLAQEMRIRPALHLFEERFGLSS